MLVNDRDPFAAANDRAEGFTFGGYITSNPILGVRFWPRVGARVIDYIVINITTFLSAFFGSIVLLLLLRGMGGNMQVGIARLQGGITITGILVAILANILYGTLSEGLHGSTIGKLVLGMQVIQEDGGHCRLVPALKRNIAYILDSLFFGAVGYMEMKKTLQEQRHGDHWAKTIVVHRSSLPIGAQRSMGQFVMGFLAALAAVAMMTIISIAIKIAIP